MLLRCSDHLSSFLRSAAFSMAGFCLMSFAAVSCLHSQTAAHSSQSSPHDADYARQRDKWFMRGRVVTGKSSAELRRRAYQAKMKLRAQQAAARASDAGAQTAPLDSWTALGPVPLASDATGSGLQNYNQVAGRATAIAIDPADPSGNTVYVGGAQGGIWKSTNGANGTANDVEWTPVADDVATLSIGALAIQPGNTVPANTTILAATGEANNSSDSYFGLGILVSTNAGNSWNLVTTANGGALSFSGLGGTHLAFSTASGQTSTVVAAMAASAEGIVEGALTSGTQRGLYTSVNAGQSWTYDALTDPGGTTTDATSATSVVYNASAGVFFAAVRYHGFYSSPDGVNWTRLAVQPAGSVLAASACPAVSTSNGQACPIYRGEITVVPGRNEMYAWFISLSSGAVVDGGIWQSLNGGASWTSISDTGIANCGDQLGCGVGQGTYDLELLGLPNGSATDLYAGATNIYKCSINTQNPICATTAFLNLTHSYGCDPIAAPSHVHPAQHALAYVIPPSGVDANHDLMYFANDGGIYRALDGFGALTTGSCSGTNGFDDLNQNLGSLTQFVSFAQHPSDPNTLLGGTQGNGSAASNQATTSSSWGNVLGGDGGFTAIDPNAPLDFYASNPDIPPGGLDIQSCADGVNCVDGTFYMVVSSSDVGGDDGGFYFPYILDPQSASSLLVGTCRVWRGQRAGGAYHVLSPNFDTLGSGTCSGNEVNVVRSITAGGPTDANGSLVIYATTNGPGPANLPSGLPAGGRVWLSTQATTGPSSFSDVTNNGPSGNINPNQFPISAVAIDSSNGTGSTAYVTVMGFTGGPGHVWKTTNAGAAWIDFTGNLPDSPVNDVVVDGANAAVYVGTDVGVFVSPTLTPDWVELGSEPSSGQAGFLPNVAVTALGLFNSGGTELLRASTYGRGIWEYPIKVVPDYVLSVSNSPLTVSSTVSGVFSGTIISEYGYASPVTLSCGSGTPPAPGTCSIPQSPVTPGNSTPFTVSVGGAPGDYTFNVQGVGTDSQHVAHSVPVTLHLVPFALSTPTPATVTVPRGTTSSPVNFNVTASGSFHQSVNIACTTAIVDATCALTPGASVSPTSSSPVPMTATVSVPASTAIGTYPVTIQATTNGFAGVLTAQFTVSAIINSTFILAEPSPFPEVNADSTGTNGPLTITAQDGFTGTVNLSCATTFGASSCSVSPASVNSFPATASLTINGSNFAKAGNYSLGVTGISGSITNVVFVNFNVGDYIISGIQSLAVLPSGQGTANFSLTSEDAYAGTVDVTCDISALSGATCGLSPASPISVAGDATSKLTATINVPSTAADGKYNININTKDTTGSPSHSFTIALTVGQDFAVTSSTASQSVSPGQTTGPYNVTIQPVGSSFNSAVTLACSGLPTGTACLFNPSTPQTPNSSAVTVVMTISTTAAASALQLPGGLGSIFYATWLFLPGIALIRRTKPEGSRDGSRKRRDAASRTRAMLATFFLLSLLLGLLPSCAGVSSGGKGGGGGTGTPAGTYQITVTGTANGIPTDPGQSTQVTLVVN
jgi:hypothetical protein